MSVVWFRSFWYSLVLANSYSKRMGLVYQRMDGSTDGWIARLAMDAHTHIDD